MPVCNLVCMEKPLTGATKDWQYPIELFRKPLFNAHAFLFCFFSKSCLAKVPLFSGFLNISYTFWQLCRPLGCYGYKIWRPTEHDVIAFPRKMHVFYNFL